MKRLVMVMLVLGLAGCAHQDLKAPCRHPAAALFVGGCGPSRPIQ